jgi:HK97 family phage portal protein
MRFDVGGPTHPTRAFYGTDHALTLVPVYACVRLIAEYIASLPIKLYIKDASTNKKARYHGPSIFDDPAPDTNQMDWIYECLTSLLLQGNAWGYVLSRDGYGYPQQIQWMPPEMVQVVDEENRPYNPLRTRVYFYGHEVTRDERVHIKAFALPGRTEAISPLRAFALTIMNGLEATRYGTDWFKAGGFPPGTFKNNEIEIDASQSSEIRSLLTQSIRRREPLVYGRDWDYHPVTIPPSEAQFLEATQMNATQIAAVYGIPPDRVGGKRGDSLTYNTVEQGALQIIEALRPWMARLETAFGKYLPQQRSVRFDAEDLLKTDLQTKANIFRTWREIGYMPIDEMRDIDDRAPLPAGVGKDTIPLEAVVGMSRSTRAIPNTLIPQITLEAKMIADYLQDIQAGRPPLADASQPTDTATPDQKPVGKGTAQGGPSPAQQAPNGKTPAGQAPAGAQPAAIGNPADPVQQYLANLIGTVRQNQSIAGLREDLAGITGSEERADEIIWAMVNRSRQQEPEYVGPWIPDRKQMNGNGRH